MLMWLYDAHLLEDDLKKIISILIVCKTRSAYNAKNTALQDRQINRKILSQYLLLMVQ